MRGELEGADRLHKVLRNTIWGSEKNEILIPKAVHLDDMLWKFRGEEDPKAIPNCNREELLEVVKGLLDHVRELDDKLVVQEQ